MTALEQPDRDLNSMNLGGRALEAFEKYDVDEVVMQENSEAPPNPRAMGAFERFLPRSKAAW